LSALIEDTSPAEVTLLLKAWRAGDEGALDRLTPLVYSELKRQARHCLRGEGKRDQMETASLVNDVFLRLVNSSDISWNDRVHFFAVSARMMRRVLVDAARARRAVKRGALPIVINLDNAPLLAASKAREVVALDDALTALGEFDSRKASVIELRFFGGLTVDETAAALGISSKSVVRDWKLAKAWIQREMGAQE
jgi:RNA polymerase sigma-70 factor (ECF subfamily)